MSGEEEHQHIKDLRLLNGMDESLPQSEVFNRTACMLAALDPVARQQYIRETENRVMAYDKSNGLRQQTQARRLTQVLKMADARLRGAGR
jgi:hypothetical protein